MSHSRRVIGFVNSAHFVDHLAMLLYPTAVLGMTGAFHRSYGEMLALSTGGFVAFGLGALPSGWLGDHWSRRRMLIVFYLGSGVSAVVTGLSTSLWMLATGLTLVGVFASIYHPVGTALLVSHAGRVGRTVGLNGVFGNLGVAFSALIAGALTQELGWRAAFLVPGALAIILGLVFAGTVSEMQATQPTAGRGRTAARGIARATVIRALGGLALATLAGGLAFNATTAALPKVFDERLSFLHGATAWVGLIVCAVYGVGAVAQLLVGTLLDRMPIKYCLLPIALLEAPLLWWAARAHDGAMVAAAAGWIFLVFANVTVNDTIVARYATPEWRSRVYALRYVLSYGVSATAVPLVALMHSAGGGFTELFMVLAGVSLLVPLGALIFPYRPQEVRQEDKPDPHLIRETFLKS